MPISNPPVRERGQAMLSVSPRLRIPVTAAMRRSLVVVLALCLMPQAALAQEDPLAGVRDEFIAAHAAARSVASPPTHPDSEALRRYPLYPYLEAARLRAILSAASGAGETDADVMTAEFLARHGGEPAARGVRRAWRV